MDTGIGDVKRKLTAIFSTDVVGYSRLMGEDELATVETLTSYKQTMSSLIRHYRGRVVDSTGDNLLAEFASVVDAVQCAVEVQQVLNSKNEALPENRRMHFRIGINLGDVIEEGEVLYGDGVNIAARVESLAEPGGICISGSAFEQIENKLALGYQYMGEHAVKNIVKPIKVYKVPMEPGTAVPAKREKAVGRRNVAFPAIAILIIAGGALALWQFYFRPPPMGKASVEKMVYPLPDKPSIAVLPFVNMSGDPKQEYFSDGLTEQIISSLSKDPALFVIARNSTFTYKGKPVKVQQVAEELGVQYVLEGGVQRSADRIRITAQLIDAIKGHHVWSERYDRDPKDIFAVEDDITTEIMKAMQITVRGDQARVWMRSYTTNLEAYEKFLQGSYYMRRFTKDDNARGRQLSEEAITIDPQFSGGYAVLGYTHFWDARFGWTASRAKSIMMAFECAQKALALDDTSDINHILIGTVFFIRGEFEKAIASAEQALALNPNGAAVYSAFAGFTGCSGRWEESIIYGKKSIRLDPFPPTTSYHWLGRAYFMTGRYDEAIQTFQKAVATNPDYLPAHAFLAACYSSQGRDVEARNAAERVLGLNPNFNLESYAKTLPYKNKSDIERYMAALHKAGLPETPPLPIPDRPSIAVLPFENMSGDPEQEYFSDGITEEIITALSKTPKLFVIARNSSFTYKGKPVWIPTVGKELGVKYVLEGSVRKAGDKVRVTAQLIDAQTNNHIWAERYDQDLKDMFAIQDQITLKILNALQVKLTEGEAFGATAKGTDNLEAYLKWLKAREYISKFTKEGIAMGRKLAEKAIALDPSFPFPYLSVSATHIIDSMFGWSESPKHSLELAEKMAQKAVDLDDSLGMGHSFLGRIHLTKREYDRAISEGERAIVLAPNGDFCHAALAYTLHRVGRQEEAIGLYKKAIRLNPHAPGWYFSGLGRCYSMTGQYEKAVREHKKNLHRNPERLSDHIALAATYVLMGREEDARTEAREILRLHPKFSAKYFARQQMYKDQDDTDRLVAALLKAGLPE